MRELTQAEIAELLGAQVVGRIGCHADGLTYVVPIIYALEGDCIYAVSIEGQKVRMMRESPNVCFEVDEYDGRGSWRSVIVQGSYEELEGEDVARALSLLTERFAARRGDGPRDRSIEADGRPTVAFRIRIREATGRAVDRS